MFISKLWRLLSSLLHFYFKEKTVISYEAFFHLENNKENEERETETNENLTEMNEVTRYI